MSETYLKKAKQKGQLNEIINKGITTTEISSIKKANNMTTSKATKELLSTLILDKQLLNIIATHENMKKLKTRLEHRITIKNKENKQLLTTNTIGKTTEEVIQDLKTTIKTNEEINKQKTPTIVPKLEEKGYQNIKITKNGNVDDINIKIIFRKA